MREFLKELGFEKELVDAIMAEHGKYVTSLKEKVEEYEDAIIDYKQQLDELSDTLEDKEKSLENLQGVADENKNLKAEVQMNGSNVKKEFSKFVTNEVMSKVDDDTDFATALGNFKKENPQYFGDTVVKKVQSSPTLGSGTNGATTTNDIMNNIIRGNVKN